MTHKYQMTEGDQDLGSWSFSDLPERVQRAIREDPAAGSWELPIEENQIDAEGRDAPPGSETINLLVEEV